MQSSFLLLAIGVLATRVAADFEDDVAGYLALYFFLGYMHEWSTHKGETTIGGKECRGTPRCSFEEFLDATTKSKGGYRGGTPPNLTSGGGAMENSKRFRSDGMTKAIEWDAQKLIIGAPSDKKILDDHLIYVMNAFSVDKGKDGADQGLMNMALDALSHIAEINAGYASAHHVRWWMSLGSPPSNVELNFIDLPADGDTSESEARSVIDVVNMAKTWGYEVPNDIRKIPVWKGGKPKRHLPTPHFLGYSAAGSETTAGAADNREQFEFATELAATWAKGLPLAERLRGPNNYPPALPSVRPIVEAYVTELTLLSERFLSLVAEALDLPPATFLSFLSDQHRLKTVHYPAQPVGSPSQGVGPHKDSSGWWTFLLQASPNVGGLQALNQAGTWVDVPPVPGTFVVNIGQAFEVVTHGVCKATTHRVVGGPEERFSVPFFQGVRRDLTREEAVDTLRGHFEGFGGAGVESAEGRSVDSAFLRGGYGTWGESQLRTKVRSHREVGERFYGEVYDQYVSDSGDQSAPR
ncbi:hypothetical protein ACHAQA_008013 [Verticillium albo-atrum]